MIDGHTHLEYGPLTKEYVREFVDKAYERGIKRLHILDHTHRFYEFKPIYEPLKTIEVQKNWLAKKCSDSIEDYIELIHECRNEKYPIEVKFGLEICHTPEGVATIKMVLDEYGHEFDFLVGAIHSIDGKLYDMNFSNRILWDVMDVNDIYKRYYELVEDLIKSDLYTQLAHPDTIKLFDYYPSYD
ncbi:MAG: PHP domain-containing protein, partial [Erysipelotrichaceae bacterium]|nr:PHP domain-containing protein [Erysipelotrichaceae bacterium]